MLNLGDGLLAAREHPVKVAVARLRKLPLPRRKPTTLEVVAAARAKGVALLLENVLRKGARGIARREGQGVGGWTRGEGSRLVSHVVSRLR